jgi:YfiH family protein
MSYLFDPVYFVEDSDTVKMGFTTAIGGVNPLWGFNLGENTAEPIDEVKRNREKYRDILGRTLEYAFADQVHGSDVAIVEEGGKIPNIDGMVTSRRNLVLNIQTADCMGIMAHDNQNGVIGAFHAGWRGTAGRIAPKGIEKMLEMGADLKHLFVYFNPAIKVQDYEVGEELLDFFPESSFERKEGKLFFNLEKENMRQLEQIGVRHIRSNFHSTYSEKNLFSYRRDGDNAGRFLNFIYLT